MQVELKKKKKRKQWIVYDVHSFYAIITSVYYILYSFGIPKHF